MSPANQNQFSARDRLVGREAMAERIKLERAAGKQIVMANGCFDVLHAGHIRYLNSAKEFGDFLVVAINSDEQVRQQKGAGRPLMPAQERAEIVASLEAVDLVTIFNEPTVTELLLLLKPEVHAKGTDYTEDTVPEREVVRAYGGRVAIAGDSKDHSSSDLIRKVSSKES